MFAAGFYYYGLSLSGEHNYNYARNGWHGDIDQP